MDALAHLYLPGALTLWCAVFFGLASLWGYAQTMRYESAGHDAGAADYRRFARLGYSALALCVTLAGFLLLLLLARRDFRIEYVQQYSGLELPFHYQVAAFWAGQKGSFLIWLVMGVLLGLPLRRAAGRAEAGVMGVYILTLFGLLFILVRENPFVMLDTAPADGDGLNPLLQDDWMVIHPPVMFVGYAASAIPFAFAVAAMWRRDLDTWAARAFPWALGGFLVLGCAILMGGYWAYKTLGWGGYWGWDPVENASLVPWLLGTVLIHGLYLERTRGRYRRANLVLACLVYLSVLYSTYLTRSGVLADFSVHSFVELGISEWLVMLIAFFVLTSVYLLATRLPTIKTEANEDPLFSRGAFMVLSTITVGLSAVIVAIGTSAPLLTAFQENPAQVGPEFYNRTNMPLALAMALLLGFVPFLTWRGTAGPALLRQAAPAIGLALATTALAAGLGVYDPFHLLFVFLAALALMANLQRTIALARSRAWGRMGGYMAHVGVGMMFLGILASSAYDQSAKLTLDQGQPTQVGDLTLTFHRYLPREGYTKERMEIEVARSDGDSYMAYPKLFVNDRTRQLMANPDVRSLALRDIYISPIQYEPGPPPAVDHVLTLQRGQMRVVENLEVTFVDFDLSAGDPTLQLASGQTVALPGQVQIRNVETGAVHQLMPIYRFDAQGAVESPPVLLPGGGLMALSGIDPATGRVQLALGNIGGGPSVGGKLSVDVTRKPLIQLLWYGLYLVLLGGAFSTVHRMRQARRIDAR
ncbi:MAG: cytochrome c biogenesis protein CcsA, partial [Acidobacteriota bacterium]